ncbi:MAG: hypothetical protein MI749_09810 [Desulfovibrionales bacterium]|nr:hypothetical protein [Desulfovibrionales bacterium]
MSTPTITQIQQAAKSGYATLDMETGTIVSGSKAFAGRVVSWITEKLHPGETAAKNGMVMNAFIRAIAADPKYGPEYANMATQTLAEHWGKGKPLTERVVQTTLNSLDTVANTADTASVTAITDGYATLCETISSGTPAAVSRSISAFLNTVDATLASSHTDATDSRVNELEQAALSAFISTTTDAALPELHRALTALENDQAQGIFAQANELAHSRGAPPALRAVNARIQSLQHALRNALSERLGAYQAPQETSGGIMRPSRKAVEDNATALLQSLGVSFTPQYLVGRSAAGQYSAAFTDRLAQDITAEFSKNRRWDGDYATDMSREMGRNTIIAEGKRVSIPGAKAADVRKKLDTFFGDDTAGKRAVSSVTHQGLFAGIFDQFTSGNGLFTGLATPSGDEHPSYEIHRNPDGGYHILASSSTAVQNLQTTTGETLPLHPEFSRFSTSIEFDISRASIDSGSPEVTMHGRQRFGYAFMPETFTIQEG